MRINKEFLLKIWRDSVWSKVISAGIIFLFGIIYAFVESLVINGSFTKSIMSILTMQIKLWHILLVIVLLLIFYLMRALYRAKDSVKQVENQRYNFLNECETNLRGYTWGWTWGEVEDSSKYEIIDLHPLCPNCKGVLTIPVIFSNYECGKCGYEVETQNVPSTSVVKKQIVSDLRNKYPDEALFIEG